MNRLGLILFLIFPFIVNANQAETFIIEFAPDQIVVTSAHSKKSSYNIIVKNRMLMPLKARIESFDLKYILPISVPQSKDRTYTFKMKKGKKYRFLPLSPPFEEILMKPGKAKYEIPPKK